jgi:hypothetical protein
MWIKHTVLVFDPQVPRENLASWESHWWCKSCDMVFGKEQASLKGHEWVEYLAKWDAEARGF